MNKAERAYQLQEEINLLALSPDQDARMQSLLEQLDRVMDTMDEQEAQRFLDLCEGRG